MHPGKFLAGLLQCSYYAGVTVLGDTLVSHLDKTEKILTTNRGMVKARDVLIATNAYTGDFIPELKRKMIPTGANLIVTEELPRELMRTVFRKLV